ncbi:MAG: hypothetical protein QOC58_99 [Mycobacterium sp.]|nr:hypothetical protein [Mycobacterium sp.]
MARYAFAIPVQGNTHQVTVVGFDTRRGRRARPQRERAMAGYLLIPRPKDVVKGWLVVTTYTFAALSAGELNPAFVLRAVLVVAVVELLVYQARYQWNDVRGFVADQNHPSSRARGRLPGPVTRAHAHVSASCAVAGLLLAATGALIVAFPGLHLGGVLGFAVVGVFGVAIAYELLRSLSTGRSGLGLPRIRPGLVLLWLTVGAGYAVRGLVGLALAVDLWKRPTLLLAALVTLWCYGISFVTARWAVEATAFAAIRDGRVNWNARSDQAREHQLALSRWIPSRVAADVTDTSVWAPLAERTALTAPWNLATVAAGTAAALTGRLLAGACSVHDGLAIAAVGAVTTLAAVCTPRRRTPVVAVAALLLLGALALLNSSITLLAVSPWVVLMGAYVFFTSRTVAKLSRGSRLTRLARRVVAAIACAVVGRSTWQAMRRSAEEREEDPTCVVPSQRWN